MEDVSFVTNVRKLFTNPLQFTYPKININCLFVY